MKNTNINHTNFSHIGFDGDDADLLQLDQQIDVKITEAIRKAASDTATKAEAMLAKGELKNGGAYRSPFPASTPEGTMNAKWLGSLVLRPAGQTTIDGESRATLAGLYAHVRCDDEHKTYCYALVTPGVIAMFKEQKIKSETILTVNLKSIVNNNKITGNWLSIIG